MKLRAITREATQSRDLVLGGLNLWLLAHFLYLLINPLTPNDLQRCRTVSPLEIKIPSKNMRENPTNTTIIPSVY
jgi:hypothetical protein